VDPATPLTDALLLLWVRARVGSASVQVALAVPNDLSCQVTADLYLRTTPWLSHSWCVRAKRNENCRVLPKECNEHLLLAQGSECAVRSEKTVGMCSEHVYVNGVDLVDELTAGSLYDRYTRFTMLVLSIALFGALSASMLVLLMLDSRRLLVEDLEHRAQSLVTQKTADHVRREFECDPEQDWDEAEKKFCCRKLELPCDDSTADLLAIALKQLQRLRQELDMNAQEIQHLEVLLQNSVDGSLKHQTPTP